MTDTTHNLDHLPRTAAWLGAAVARPKAMAAACVFVMAGLGWLTLGWLYSEMDALSALCGPLSVGNGGWTCLALVVLMWSAMALAMMLPSAAPMILTYAEIADVAARKKNQIVSPLVLAGGYAIVWLGFAIAVALAQFIFLQFSLLGQGMRSIGGLFSGVIFIAAGAYQFSPLKDACLRQCRQPFTFFFTNWATTPRGVFRLGLKQGLYCLGCCWAMMLVMFAVGVMNIVWMALLGIVMTIEKIGAGKRFTHAVGAMLAAIGAVFVMSAVMVQ